MHENRLVHADLEPVNVLLRGAGAFQDGWRRQLGRAMGLIPGGGAESAGGVASACGAASAREGANEDESLELTYHLPASFEVRCF